MAVSAPARYHLGDFLFDLKLIHPLVLRSPIVHRGMSETRGRLWVECHCPLRRIAIVLSSYRLSEIPRPQFVTGLFPFQASHCTANAWPRLKGSQLGRREHVRRLDTSSGEIAGMWPITFEKEKT